MLREQARLDRAMAARGADRSSDKPHKPLFGPPVKGHSSDTAQVRAVLGSYDDVKNVMLGNYTPLVGVQLQPETPTVVSSVNPFSNSKSYMSQTSSASKISSSAVASASVASSQSRMNGSATNNGVEISNQKSNVFDMLSAAVRGRTDGESNRNSKVGRANDHVSSYTKNERSSSSISKVEHDVSNSSNGWEANNARMEQMHSDNEKLNSAGIKSHSKSSKESKLQNIHVNSSSSKEKKSSNVKLSVQSFAGAVDLSHQKPTTNTNRMSIDSIDAVLSEMITVTSPIPALSTHSPYREQKFTFPQKNDEPRNGKGVANAASSAKNSTGSSKKPDLNLLNLDLDMSSDSDDNDTDDDNDSPRDSLSVQQLSKSHANSRTESFQLPPNSNKLPELNTAKRTTDGNQLQSSTAHSSKISCNTSSTSAITTSSFSLGKTSPAASSTSSAVKMSPISINRTLHPNVGQSSEKYASSSNTTAAVKGPISSILASSTASSPTLTTTASRTPAIKTSSPNIRLPISSSDCTTATTSPLRASLSRSQPSVTFKTTSPAVPSAIVSVPTDVSQNDAKLTKKSTPIASKPSTKSLKTLSESSESSSSSDSETDNDSIATDAGEGDREMDDMKTNVVPTIATAATAAANMATEKVDNSDDTGDSQRNWSLGTWLRTSPPQNSTASATKVLPPSSSTKISPVTDSSRLKNLKNEAVDSSSKDNRTKSKNVSENASKGKQKEISSLEKNTLENHKEKSHKEKNKKGGNENLGSCSSEKQSSNKLCDNIDNESKSTLDKKKEKVSKLSDNTDIESKSFQSEKKKGKLNDSVKKNESLVRNEEIKLNESILEPKVNLETKTKANSGQDKIVKDRDKRKNKEEAASTHNSSKKSPLLFSDHKLNDRKRVRSITEMSSDQLSSDEEDQYEVESKLPNIANSTYCSAVSNVVVSRSNSVQSDKQQLPPVVSLETDVALLPPVCDDFHTSPTRSDVEMVPIDVDIAIEPVFHPKFGVSYNNGHPEVLVQIDLTRLQESDVSSLLQVTDASVVCNEDVGPPAKRALYDSRVAIVGPYNHSAPLALSSGEAAGLSHEASRFAEASVRLLSNNLPRSLSESEDVSAAVINGIGSTASASNCTVIDGTARFKHAASSTAAAAAENVRMQIFPNMDHGLTSIRIPRKKPETAFIASDNNEPRSGNVLSRPSSLLPFEAVTQANLEQNHRRLDGERISENRRVLDESNDNSSFGHMVDEWLDNRDTHKWRVELESDRRYRGQRVRDWDAPSYFTSETEGGLSNSQSQQASQIGNQWAAIAGKSPKSLGSNYVVPAGKQGGGTYTGATGKVPNSVGSGGNSRSGPINNGRDDIDTLLNREDAADKFLQEAKRLKHEADNSNDRLVKQLKYVEAVVSFVLCGLAMDKDSLSEPNKIFKMYDDTLRLLRHMVGPRPSTEMGGGREHDKELKLAALSYRLQALLNLRLYKLRRADTVKLKKIIDDYNKQQSKSSSYVANPRALNLPSPTSPQPSPAGSIGSVGSTSSTSGDASFQRQFGNSSTSASASGGVNIPQRIHTVTQQYLSHVSHLHLAHEMWDQADSLINSLPRTEFFAELDRECDLLTMHSTMTQLVCYVRAGLCKLKDS